MNYFLRLQSAIDFIEDNLTKDITLAKVAKEANCSLYHFHRIFKVLVGNSVKEYIRNMVTPGLEKRTLKWRYGFQ